MSSSSVSRHCRFMANSPTAQRHGQGGQALAEGMVVLLVLLSLWVAVARLGRLQEMALTFQHASSHAAFAAARFDTRSISDYTRARFFSGPAHQWKDRAGLTILGALSDQLDVSLERSAMLPPSAQPGGTGVAAS